MNNVMKEFVVHYKAHKDASEVSPCTMMGYINGLHRIIKGRECQIDILRDETFADKYNAFRQVWTIKLPGSRHEI